MENTNRIEKPISIRNDSTRLAQLKAVNKQRFVGLAVDSLLADPVLAAYSEYLFLDEPGRLILLYARNLYLEVFINDSFFQNNVPEPFLRWSFTDIKKEKILQLNLQYKGTLVEKAGNAFPNSKRVFYEIKDSVLVPIERQ